MYADFHLARASGYLPPPPCCRLQRVFGERLTGGPRGDGEETQTFPRSVCKGRNRVEISGIGGSSGLV